jgi:hypothetical protein
MSIVEGGPFSCTSCSDGFKGNSLQEFNDHVVNHPELHLQSGSAFCAYCQKVVDFKDELAIPHGATRHIICDSCNDKVNKSLELKQQRRQELIQRQEAQRKAEASGKVKKVTVGEVSA